MYAPLAALGSRLQQQDFFAPLREHVQLDCKAVFHAPHEKLLDVIVSMLADRASLKQINTRLRPDTALATSSFNRDNTRICPPWASSALRVVRMLYGLWVGRDPLAHRRRATALDAAQRLPL
jgi:hypothetical protein